MAGGKARWIYLLFLIGFFIFILINPVLLEGFLRVLFPRETMHIYQRIPGIVLVRQHLVMVSVSTLIAFAIGFPIGIFVTRRSGKDFLPAVNDLVSLAQTFPPIAVLALAVPILGFGFRPTILALFLYSILPIVRNTISGLESVPEEVYEAARGMGMNSRQRFLQVEFPLASRIILAGLRIAVIINIGTATAGSVIGAGGLGVPIVSGLVWNNPALVMGGAIQAALLALIFDQFIGLIDATFLAKFER